MSGKEPKSCILPMAKIKLIMKTYSEVDNVSNEATFVMTKAAEGFLAMLLRQALISSEDKREVDYPDLVQVSTNVERFAFLTDIICPKIKGREYLKILKEVEEEEKRIALEDGF